MREEPPRPGFWFWSGVVTCEVWQRKSPIRPRAGLGLRGTPRNCKPMSLQHCASGWHTNYQGTQLIVVSLIKPPANRRRQPVVPIGLESDS